MPACASVICLSVSPAGTTSGSTNALTFPPSAAINPVCNWSPRILIGWDLGGWLAIYSRTWLVPPARRVPHYHIVAAGGQTEYYE